MNEGIEYSTTFLPSARGLVSDLLGRGPVRVHVGAGGRTHHLHLRQLFAVVWRPSDGEVLLEGLNGPS